ESKSTNTQLILSQYAVHRRTHRPFPTRRSSDLSATAQGRHTAPSPSPMSKSPPGPARTAWSCGQSKTWGMWCPRAKSSTRGWERSEEHTSELQSRFDLVCRLLLEKKKLSRGT